MERLLADFRWADHGASHDVVKRVEAVLGELPADYVSVLRDHDGGEGWVGDGAYLTLWPAEDLERLNVSLEASDALPGMVLFGGDGADDLYAIEPSSGGYWVFPAVGLRADAGERLAEGWDGFLEALSMR